ncbi:MAG: hypothetical protein RXR03_06785, partial [Thermocladium sp.]
PALRVPHLGGLPYGCRSVAIHNKGNLIVDATELAALLSMASHSDRSTNKLLTLPVWLIRGNRFPGRTPQPIFGAQGDPHNSLANAFP